MRTFTEPLNQENKRTSEGSDSSTEETLSPSRKRANTRAASPFHGFDEDGASWTVQTSSCEYHMLRFMIPVSVYYIAKGGWKCEECGRDGEGPVKHCINCNKYDRCDSCDARDGFDDVCEKK